MSRRRSSRRRPRPRSRTNPGAILRRPLVQIGIVLLVAALVFLIASLGGGQSSKTENGLPELVSVGEAYQMYQEGVFVLDVRTVEEWNDFHVPGTTLIPLDELESRLGEVPADRQILVVCNSGNRSQVGRDILLQAGFDAVSMEGGLKAWRDSGYPVVSGP